MGFDREPKLSWPLAAFQFLAIPTIALFSIQIGLSSNKALMYKSSILFGLLFGSLMGWAFRDAIRSAGKRVWVAQTILLVLLILDHYQASIPGRTFDWFWPHWSEQRSGFGYLLLTLPAVASGSYSSRGLGDRPHASQTQSGAGLSLREA
jgi:hypothetical protein